MGVGTREHLAMKHTGQVNVGPKPGSAGHLLQAVQSWRPCAYYAKLGPALQGPFRSQRSSVCLLASRSGCPMSLAGMLFRVQNPHMVESLRLRPTIPCNSVGEVLVGIRCCSPAQDFRRTLRAIDGPPRQRARHQSPEPAGSLLKGTTARSMESECLGEAP